MIIIQDEYIGALSRPTSPEFANLSRRISNAIGKIYKNDDNYVKTQIQKFTNGSIEAYLELIFNSIDSSSLVKLIDAIEAKTFSGINVVGIIVIEEGNCSSAPCSPNEICNPREFGTYSCDCMEGYSSNGTFCQEDIEVKVRIVVQRVFTEQLKNKSSPEYIELKKNVTIELENLFKNTPNFLAVIVTGFRNGSTIVNFKVIYRRKSKDKTNKKVVVGRLLQRDGIDGFIGSLKVKIQGLVLEVSPPPPREVAHDDLTSKSVSISWTKPEEAELFAIKMYGIKYKIISENKFQNQTITSSEHNMLLDNLESNTFYIITVYGINDFGNGDESESLRIITKKSSDNGPNVVIIVVVVVVLVVILIIIVVLLAFYRIRRRRMNRPNHGQPKSRKGPDSQNPVQLQNIFLKNPGYQVE